MVVVAAGRYGQSPGDIAEVSAMHPTSVKSRELANYD